MHRANIINYSSQTLKQPSEQNNKYFLEYVNLLFYISFKIILKYKSVCDISILHMIQLLRYYIEIDCKSVMCKTLSATKLYAKNCAPKSMC